MRIIINLGLILAFSIVYMEWGGGHSAFIFNAEYEILFKQKSLLQSITHPIILAGLIGQIALFYNAFAAKPIKIVQILGMVALGIIVFLVLLSGILSLNIKSIGSALPYIGFCIFYFMKRNTF